jgi:hypothetical protein
VQLFYINEAKIADMDMLTMVPLFMKDLLSIMDRGVVFEMVRIPIEGSLNNASDFFLFHL